MPLELDPGTADGDPDIHDLILSFLIANDLRDWMT